MRAGRLDRKVTLQRLSVAQTGSGAAKHAYTDVATVWAAVEPLKGEEFHEAAKTVSAVTHRLLLRYRADVEPTWRILYGLRRFAISAVLNSGEGRRELQLMCRELPNGEEP
jgi:SPP1 family predicted phage head-tail adaptor